MFMEAFSPVRPLKGKIFASFHTSTAQIAFYHLPLNPADPIQRENEYAVITGGNQGIGWFTIKTLVESGMTVIVGKICCLKCEN